MAELGNTSKTSRKESRKRSKREARWSAFRSTQAAESAETTELVLANQVVAAQPESVLNANTDSSHKGMYRMLVMGVAAALVGTIALPAYAMNPGYSENDAYSTAYEDQDSQAVANGSEATISASRDGFTASAAAARQFTSTASSAASYKSVLANPPNPNFSLSGIFAEGMKYIGTPYVAYGASPAGFDCSGFTSYVYATFGVALPHQSEGQRAMGTPISEADAQPGDIVWMPGHVGLWGGPGMILDAPVPGGSVQLRRIWTSNYQVIRIGI